MLETGSTWEAEGRLLFANFTSFVAELLRTDQAVLDQPFPSHDSSLYEGMFWSSATTSAREGADLCWQTNLPRGSTDAAQANLFHERVHYAQLMSYPIFQHRFLIELERIRIGITEHGGWAGMLCGAANALKVAPAAEVAADILRLQYVIWREPELYPPIIGIDGVENAWVARTHTTPPLPFVPGAAGLLGQGKATQVVPFTVLNLVESAACVAQHLFQGSSLPRRQGRLTSSEIRYLGCWELWCRFHEKRFQTSNEASAAFLAAVDLALSAHALAYYDDKLKEQAQDPERAGTLRFPSIRFADILLRLGRTDVDFHVGIQGAHNFQQSLSQALGWAPPERGYRFMAAWLTRQLLLSSSWTFEHLIRMDKAHLEWAAFTATLSEIADDIEQLQPVWRGIAESFATGRDRRALNFVFGTRIVGKMISAARLRCRRPAILAAPHDNPNRLWTHFPLPTIRMGNHYYMDWDLAHNDYVQDELTLSLEPFGLTASDMMPDCLGIAALAPLADGSTRCGLIDPATGEANCLYVAGGAGCPQVGLTSEQHGKRQDSGIHDWCHWTNAVIRMRTAPPVIRDAWIERWRHFSQTPTAEVIVTPPLAPVKGWSNT
ncbi:MAG TPA: hypothetical protein VF861_15005 [Telluria sp.]